MKILIDQSVIDQALEALEKLDKVMKRSPDTNSAITALRQAIEQAEKQEPVAWRDAALRVGEDLCSVGPFRYYDMTAEQWLDWALSVVTVHAPPPPQQAQKQEPVIDHSAAVRIATALGWEPKREWVGLTEVEIVGLTCECVDDGTFNINCAIDFAHAIEDSLKQKNGYTEENT